MLARGSSTHALGVLLAFALVLCPAFAFATRPVSLSDQAPAASSTRQIGTVKAVLENGLVLVTDSGSEFRVGIGETSRLLRAEPGQTSLKTAVSIQLREIQVGDRVLIRGRPSGDGQSIMATLVVAIKKAAIEAKHEHEREDWKKRGLGGLVKEVDPVSRTITISTSALEGSMPVVVHLSPHAVLRRYAPGSVRFEDARLGKFEEIRAGDQFRGRGDRSADGREFEAEEIITGSFRSIAGTVSSADAGAKILTIADLITKQPVRVRITADTSLRKLPEAMAEGIAHRLGGGPPGPPEGGPPAGAGGEAPHHGNPPAAGRPRNGPRDFQQMIARLPAASFADFPAGEAVMIVATSGNDPSEATAINLLGGAEPLLRASPEGSQQMMITPWNLGGSAAQGEGQQM